MSPRLLASPLLLVLLTSCAQDRIDGCQRHHRSSGLNRTGAEFMQGAGMLGGMAGGMVGGVAGSAIGMGMHGLTGLTGMGGGGPGNNKPGGMGDTPDADEPAPCASSSPPPSIPGANNGSAASTSRPSSTPLTTEEEKITFSEDK